jgi:hypothetical protein
VDFAASSQFVKTVGPTVSFSLRSRGFSGASACLFPSPIFTPGGGFQMWQMIARTVQDEFNIEFTGIEVTIGSESADNFERWITVGAYSLNGAVHFLLKKAPPEEEA